MYLRCCSDFGYSLTIQGKTSQTTPSAITLANGDGSGIAMLFGYGISYSLFGGGTLTPVTTTDMATLLADFMNYLASLAPANTFQTITASGSNQVTGLYLKNTANCIENLTAWLTYITSNTLIYSGNPFTIDPALTTLCNPLGFKVINGAILIPVYLPPKSPEGLCLWQPCNTCADQFCNFPNSVIQFDKSCGCQTTCDPFEMPAYILPAKLGDKYNFCLQKGDAWSGDNPLNLNWIKGDGSILEHPSFGESATDTALWFQDVTVPSADPNTCFSLAITQTCTNPTIWALGTYAAAQETYFNTHHFFDDTIADFMPPEGCYVYSIQTAHFISYLFMRSNTCARDFCLVIQAVATPDPTVFTYLETLYETADLACEDVRSALPPSTGWTRIQCTQIATFILDVNIASDVGGGFYVHYGAPYSDELDCAPTPPLYVTVPPSSSQAALAALVAANIAIENNYPYTGTPFASDTKVRIEVDLSNLTQTQFEDICANWVICTYDQGDVTVTSESLRATCTTTCPAADVTNILATSQQFQFIPDVDCFTSLIKWSNEETGLEFPYSEFLEANGSPFFNLIRLGIYLKNPQQVSKREEYRQSNGVYRIPYAVLDYVFDLETDNMGVHEHNGFNVALQHDYLSIGYINKEFNMDGSDVIVFQQEAYKVEWIQDYPQPRVAKATGKVKLYNYDNKNSKC